MYQKTNKFQNEDIELLSDTEESKNDESIFIKVADNAITDLEEEEVKEIISDMYEEVDDEYIEMFEEMSGSEIKEKLDAFNDKYEVGEAFSEEDEALLLYAYEEYAAQENKTEDFLQVVYTTRKHTISNTKTKCGIKVGYSGSLSTYTTCSYGKYMTNVKVTKYSGTAKSMQWKTSHSAYGLIGTSGKSASLGLVYTGNTKSSKYTNTFSFDKTTKYSALAIVYHSTWGTLDVKTSSGEFNMNTKTYSSVE